MRITRPSPLLAASLIGSLTLTSAALPPPVGVRNLGLAAPESVFYDAGNDVYLVSNVNGDPFALDGNGFISRFSGNGKLLDLKWIAGGKGGVILDSPKGMTAVGNTLYVSDVHTVRKFDLKTGRPRGAVTIAGTSFLNDLTVDRAGAVYVSDMGVKAGAQGFAPTGTDAVYRISPADHVDVLAKGTFLKQPNGLLALPNGKIEVVPFASNEVYTLDARGRRGDVVKLPGGALDGVVAAKDGRLLVSSWETSSIYAVDDGHRVSVLADHLPSPADIGLDTKRDRLLVPIINENRLVFQPLK
ncbi:SMP-30/gluconolactonase/LRE family protein [Deinococcus hopiensis]|uniref:SMP-30/Gluconolactonase/LRE-like region domain-containing protein n=1 Tax=Deinococcus hopiensis KR-140 TaxID=695939 RepID=A0A1W1VFZ0_9DEIO|nr:SMP-30/gluconolactonase/LRE family protein [Deinococcus hopiensis]SMB92150.1 hypothetical protein SAMN00790413_01463 [Deinococcus hopiensis KR-140]